MDVVTASPTEARELLSAALSDFHRAADSLGHIAVAQQTHQLAAVLAADGASSARDALLQGSAKALARRGVLPGVVAALRQGLADPSPRVDDPARPGPPRAGPMPRPGATRGAEGTGNYPGGTGTTRQVTIAARLGQRVRQC